MGIHPDQSTFDRRFREAGEESRNSGLRRRSRGAGRIGALAPFIAIVDEPVVPPALPSIPEPWPVSYTNAIRLARNDGRLTNPTATGYRLDFEFDRPGASALDWWNGLLYSRWRLIALRWLHPMFAAPATPDRHGKTEPLSELTDWERPLTEKAQRVVNLLVALEARYLPEIRAPWLR
jgi:hypothetical protein